MSENSTSIERSRDILEKAADLLLSSQNLKRDEEDAASAETLYLEALALEAASLLDSPALRDMPLERFKSHGSIATLLKAKKASDLFRRTVSHGERGGAPAQAASLAFDASGQLWAFTSRLKGYQPVLEPLPEELSYPILTGTLDTQIEHARRGNAVRGFENLVTTIKRIHSLVVKKTEERTKYATQNTPRL